MKIITLESFLWLIFRLSLLGICVALLIEKAHLAAWQKRLNAFLGIREKRTPMPSVRNPSPDPLPPPQPDVLLDDLGTETAAPTTAPKARMPEKKRIGQILLEKHFITQEVLDEALAYQQEHGGTITQYLLQSGRIDEKQLARCLCEQFKVPYLPIDSYEISDEVINMVPTDIVEKHWILPLEKTGNTLTVAMIDPLDTDAIRELEELTAMKILPMVGMISEILTALQTYYRIMARYHAGDDLPFFIRTTTYTGKDRRRAVRYPAKIDLRFPAESAYVTTQTSDVSRKGLRFHSPQALPLGKVINVEITPPKNVSPLPIAAVSKVVRCVPHSEKKFEIGVEILKIGKDELACVLEYAMQQCRE